MADASIEYQSTSFINLESFNLPNYPYVFEFNIKKGSGTSFVLEIITDSTTTSVTLSTGDKILVPGTGQFSLGWAEIARSLGIHCIHIESDWRHGIDPAVVKGFLDKTKMH